MAERLDPAVRKYIEDQIRERGLERNPENALSILNEVKSAGADSPQPVAPPQSEIRNKRGVFLAGGALAGGALGSSATGGNPAGMLIGSGLGTQAALQANEGMARIEDRFIQGASTRNVMDELLQNSSLEQMVETQRGMVPEMKREALLDAGGVLGGEVVGMAVRKGLSALTGFGDAARSDLAAQRHELGENVVGLQEVSEAPFIRGAQQTIGAFPLLNKPFLESATRRSAALEKRNENLMFAVGPVVGVAESGVRITNSADAAFGAWRDVVEEGYANAFKAAEDAGAVIPVTNTVEAAARVLDEIGELPSVVRKGKAAKAKIPGDETAAAVAEELSKLDPSGMTVPQYKNLGKKLTRLADSLKDRSGERRLVIQLKKALENDLADIAAPPEVRQLLNTADRRFASGMEFFDGTTANKLRRVDRNFGKIRNVSETARESDEVARIILNTESPKAIRRFRGLMGRAGTRGMANYRAAVASHLDDIMQDATKTDRLSGIDVLDFSSVKKRLGLAKPRSPRFRATEEMLKGTGVSIGDLQRFMRVAEENFAQGIPSAAQMVRRRAVLGGGRAIVTSFSPGSTRGSAGASKSTADSAIRSILGFALFFAGGRKIAKGLTSPQSLRRLEGALDVGTRGQDAGNILDKGLLGEVVADPKKIRLLTTIFDLKTPPIQRRKAIRRLSIIMPTLFAGEQMQRAVSEHFEEFEATPGGMAGEVTQFFKELTNASQQRQRVTGQRR